MFNPALDTWIWVTSMLFLGVLGARAWVVETGQGRLGRTPARVRVLTGATVAVLALLVTLVAVQGGALLARSLLTGTNPTAAAPAVPAPTPPDPGTPAGG